MPFIVTMGQDTRSLNFCCTCLKTQSNAELKGLDVESLATEHIQVSKAPQDVVLNLLSSWEHSLQELPCHMQMILSKRSGWFLSQKKKISQKKQQRMAGSKSGIK